jgi:hypothetical protein
MNSVLCALGASVYAVSAIEGVLPLLDSIGTDGMFVWFVLGILFERYLPPADKKP